MSKKKITEPRSNLEVLNSIRRDWGDVKPAMRIFGDRQEKREQKYPKQTLEQEYAEEQEQDNLEYGPYDDECNEEYDEEYDYE